MPHTTCTVKTKLAKELTTPILDSVKNMTIIRFMSDEKVEILRRHRIQITAQRLAVLRAVSNWPHCTADVVAEKVRSEIGAISRQAVYDVLGVLVDKGIIRRIEPAGSPALYEDRVGDNHHHLICRKCGKTVDVNCSSGKTPCLTPDEKMGYEVDKAELIFWGTCPECLPANQSRANK